ncbi:MAG: GNAT family N-acetyltransferase [Flavobacteriaceae bacterium]|nr:GNAT family N-acetyltransferase [Flavobacteriaceae bacterium]MBL4905593.1 GNAT family N-acetyltransferase [Flavobacteriaceae bacterium]
MIERLQNKDIGISNKIRSVFQLSYAVEAKILNAIDFPPLKRSLENYVKSKTAFYGYFKNEDLAGVIEIVHNDSFTHIQSLVVDPKFFRQGIARKLMEFVFDTYDSTLFVVETGLENRPATELYQKIGFIEVKQWDTDYGIRKVKFELRRNS